MTLPVLARGCGAAVDGAYGDHRGVNGPHTTGDDSMQPVLADCPGGGDDLRRQQDGVKAPVGIGAVSLLPTDGNVSSSASLPGP